MKHLLPLSLAICLVALVSLAARPARTLSELGADVDAINRRVAVLEREIAAMKAVPKPQANARDQGPVSVGMTPDEVRKVLAENNSRVGDSRKVVEAGGTLERWRLNPRTAEMPAYVFFRDGVVERVEHAN